MSFRCRAKVDMKGYVMGAVSEKVLYDNLIQARYATKGARPSNLVLWGEDIVNGKLILFPKKTNLLPEYDSICRGTTGASLIYFDKKKQQPVLFCDIRYDKQTQNVYMSAGIFNDVWKFLKESVKTGIELKRDRGEAVEELPEGYVDLTFLQHRLSEAVVKNDRIEYVSKDIPERKQKSRSKMQSALDNPAYRFFYAFDSGIYHDKDCEFIREIPPELFTASEKRPITRKPCRRCLRIMCLRELCSPYVKQMPTVNRLLKRGDIGNNYLERLAFEYGIKLRADEDGSLVVVSAEDTWKIRGFDKDSLSLWQNNYIKTSQEERCITQGFHHKKTADGRTLFQMLERIRRYKYDPHFHENAEVKAETQNTVKEQIIGEADGKKELFKRLAGIFGRLFHKDKNN